MTAEVRAFLGLGSNLGDRLQNLRTAVELLDASDGIDVLRCSRVYETAPVGPPQPDYLNAVAEVATVLASRELLAGCLAVEARLGRVRGERWGPRVVDIDVLTFGRWEIHEPGLIVPHPRMHQRAFVLAPLLELDRDPMLPGGRRLGSVRLPGMGVGDVRPYAPPVDLRGGAHPQRSPVRYTL